MTTLTNKQLKHAKFEFLFTKKNNEIVHNLVNGGYTYQPVKQPQIRIWFLLPKLQSFILVNKITVNGYNKNGGIKKNTHVSTENFRSGLALNIRNTKKLTFHIVLNSTRYVVQNTNCTILGRLDYLKIVWIHMSYM